MKYLLLSFFLVFMTFSSALFAKSGGTGNTNKEQKTNLETEKTNKEWERQGKGSQQQDKDSEQNSKGDEKEPNPEKLLQIGNLAFPVSQQPGPLISFGQNLIPEKQVQVQVLPNQFKGKDEYFINIVPSIIYAFRDDTSIFISVPDAIRYREHDRHSSGIGDVLIQFEHAPYTEEYSTYYDQISIVANVTIPIGSTKKHPVTGIGSNSFFIGGVFARMGIDWFSFVSYGGIFTASSHRTKFGNQFLYQYGVGRRIFNTKDWLCDWMVEFNGTYACRNKIEGVTAPNSGGNIIYVTPSIFIASNESFAIQFGIGFPIQQHLFGHQNRKEYLLALNVFWAF